MKIIQLWIDNKKWDLEKCTNKFIYYGFWCFKWMVFFSAQKLSSSAAAMATTGSDKCDVLVTWFGQFTSACQQLNIITLTIRLSNRRIKEQNFLKVTYEWAQTNDGRSIYCQWWSLLPSHNVHSAHYMFAPMAWKIRCEWKGMKSSLRPQSNAFNTLNGCEWFCSLSLTANKRGWKLRSDPVLSFILFTLDWNPATSVHGNFLFYMYIMWNLCCLNDYEISRKYHLDLLS